MTCLQSGCSESALDTVTDVLITVCMSWSITDSYSLVPPLAGSAPGCDSTDIRYATLLCRTVKR